MEMPAIPAAMNKRNRTTATRRFMAGNSMGKRGRGDASL
jgi:hypothetical protein